jgi:hypothetical protein
LRLASGSGTLDILKDKMWEIDPIDFWTAAVLAVGYSLPFLALEIEFKLQELRRRAEDKAIQKAIVRRLTGHD